MANSQLKCFTWSSCHSFRLPNTIIYAVNLKHLGAFSRNAYALHKATYCQPSHGWWQVWKFEGTCSKVGDIICPPHTHTVEIGLTDKPKSGEACAPPPPPRFRHPCFDERHVTVPELHMLRLFITELCIFFTKEPPWTWTKQSMYLTLKTADL